MFQSFITFATLLATGAHALFGCCWHHDHARHHAGGEMVQAVPESEVVNHACGCHHACKTASHRDTDQHREPLTVTPSDACPCGHPHDQDSAPCDEGHCQYVMNAKVELPSLQGLIMPFAMIPADFDAKLLSGGPRGTRDPHLSASLLSGSLCVRDLTQIALI